MQMLFCAIMRSWTLLTVHILHTCIYMYLYTVYYISVYCTHHTSADSMHMYIMYPDTTHCDLEEGMDAEGVVWNMDGSAWNGDCSGMEGSRPATDSCIVRNLVWLPW